MKAKRIFLSVLCAAAVTCCRAQSYQEVVERGMSQLKNDSLAAAEASFREAMQIAPALKSNALLFRHIGQIQERTGRDHDALESYSLGLNLSPSTLGLLLDRASLYLRLGNEDRAISDYSTVLDLNADHTEALFFRAYLYTRRSDYKKGRADYEHLLKLQPTHEKAILGLALLNEKDNRPREATELLNGLIQQYPQHALNYVVRGGMEQDRKQYELAIFDFDKAIALEPTNPEHLISRAGCYIQMRRKKLARRDLQAALELGADKKLVAEMMSTMK